MGKAVVIAMLLAALLGGVGIWYTQTRAYYSEVAGPVSLTFSTGGDLTTLPASEVRAIASVSSPLGFRACFAHDLDLLTVPDLADPHAQAAPTVAPGWFDCFDAKQVAGLLDDGLAQGFVAMKNVAFGVDRIVALSADGRGWAWHELNECGRKSYDGTPVGEACPDRATYTPLTEGSL
ncbi:DUF6446 family protein [Jannaschia sp. M317]|uniref:DUF6446 family protein n=1 Tax=Jannaschia sp. M317 TaxID=2867011 RepID=UPI0021A5FB59|nr:DUF6446 family protein [Jannaschia sp. M317]UWQ17251.1 histidine kinase [Jannaschia sp. M317]